MELRFLGTGASEGIPAINCHCSHCRRAAESGGRLTRRRSAILCSTDRCNLLIEAPPDIRELINEQCRGVKLGGVFVSHAHYGHAAGLEELRHWQGKPTWFRDKLKLFVAASVHDRLGERTWFQGQMNDVFHVVVCSTEEPTVVGDLSLTPFAVEHGEEPTFGLVVEGRGRKVVYTSDMAATQCEKMPTMAEQADLLIANTPTFLPPKADHITVQDAVKLKIRLKAQKVVLTHISHKNKTYDALRDYAKGLKGVVVAYDGLRLRI